MPSITRLLKVFAAVTSGGPEGAIVFNASDTVGFWLVETSEGLGVVIGLAMKFRSMRQPLRPSQG
jgi:hypothetical protein